MIPETAHTSKLAKYPLKRKAPQSSQGFAGSPHGCGLVWSRHRDGCRWNFTGVGLEPQ